MKLLPKNWSLQIKKYLYCKKEQVIMFLFFLTIYPAKSQIANYVNNGGFEECINCSQSFAPNVPKYWNATDTGSFFGVLMTMDPPSMGVPNSSYTYQWPRHGKNFMIGTEFFSTCSNQSCVGYPRNRLKKTLQSGKVYCFKMYVNLSNESTHAISNLGVLFADSSTDTIKYCTLPITYLTPNIQNTSGFISDTSNWTTITGNYTANGTEKYIMIGNFNSSTNTNTLFVNPKNLPGAFSAYCYDDISLIELNLPALAGRDTFFIPGDSIYLGRPSDVGIDEACMWYKLPNTTTAIDTVAGLWVKPVTTTTYMVKQDICGVIKWDTVVLYQSAIGVHELDLIGNNLKIYPQPAQDVLNIQINVKTMESFNHIVIFNSFGQIIREEEINFIDNKAILGLNNLANGVYHIFFNDQSHETITKKLVITH